MQTVEACPGNCVKEEKIDRILKEFPDLSLEEVTTKMKEIGELEEYVKKAKG